MPVAVTLATPAAAAPVAACFAVALVAVVLSGRRVRVLRRALRLGPGRRRWLLLDVSLVALAGLLLALAATQPAVARTRTRWTRPSAEVLFAFDVSRSMLAAASPHSPTRLERARALALGVRPQVPELPVGVVSFWDRALPLSPPDDDLGLFRDTVGQLIRAGEPPPQFGGTTVSTNLSFGLQQLETLGYFRRGTRDRTLVLFTDAETDEPVDATLGRSFAAARIHVLLVRVHAPGERVWNRRGRPEPYRPDVSELGSVRHFVQAAGGRMLSETQEGALVAALRDATSAAPRVASGREREPEPIGAWFVLAAMLPLGAVGLLRVRA